MTIGNQPGQVADSDPLSSLIDAALATLLHEQEVDGSFPHGFDMGVMPDAQTVIFLTLLDFRDALWTRALLGRLIDLQRADGSWGPYEGAPGDLSTTVECYYALALHDAWRLQPQARIAAEQWITGAGGIHACRNLTKVLLAIGGEVSWLQLPSPALYAWLWSPFSPFQIQDVVTFTRLHVASMVVLAAHRYVSPVARHSVLDHMTHASSRQASNVSHRKLAVPRWLLRRCLHDLYSQRELDGTLAGYHSSTFLFLFAQRAMGRSLQQSDIEPCVRAIRRNWGCPFGDATAHQQTCDAHIWNTALSIRVLRQAGLSRQHAGLRSGVEYLWAHQQGSQWDWRRKQKTLPGGWGFSSNNTRHPDTDDTVACLDALADAPGSHDENWQRGIRWLLSRQNRDGGWSAFDRNCARKWMEHMPANDMRHAITDPSTPDLTARVVELLIGRHVLSTTDRSIGRAIRWLLAAQERDGSWYGRWGTTYVYGTWCVVRALCTIARSDTTPRLDRSLRRAGDWLLQIQKPDGSFGESCASDQVGHYVPSAPSVPSQTAWALDALLWLCEVEPDPIHRRRLDGACAHSADWLVDIAGGGTWSETMPTGSAFPGALHIRYHLYPKVWPLVALLHYRALMPDASERR
ncbi:MAG: hypothetical protein OWU32_01845 [Firmicutes bacterium]|nr:hypothetical protein [Bacillota bacterium]